MKSRPIVLSRACNCVVVLGVVLSIRQSFLVFGYRFNTTNNQQDFLIISQQNVKIPAHYAHQFSCVHTGSGVARCCFTRKGRVESVHPVMSKSMTCEGVCVCMCTRVTRAHSTKEWFTFEISHSKGVWCFSNGVRGMGGRGLPR